MHHLQAKLYQSIKICGCGKRLCTICKLNYIKASNFDSTSCQQAKENKRTTPQFNTISCNLILKTGNALHSHTRSPAHKACLSGKELRRGCEKVPGLSSSSGK